MNLSILETRTIRLYLTTAIILLGALLILADLPAKSLYYDEILHVQIESSSFGRFIEEMTDGIGIHPILAPLLRHLWMRIAGTSALAARYLPAAFGVLCLPLLYVLVRDIGGDILALLSTYCLALAPVFVMYARFDKYYSQSIFVALLSVVTFVRLLKKNAVGSWLTYALGYVILIHTHYLTAPFTILGQNLVVLYSRRTDRAFLKRWFVGQLVLPLTYLPWLMPALSHTDRIAQRQAADVTQGWRGVLVKTAYLTYSFTMGETVFPWEPAAIVGLPVIVGLTALGLYSLWRSKHGLAGQRRLFAFSIVFGLLPSFGGIALSLFAFPSVPFIDLPNHLLFALPFCRIALAAGIAHLQRLWRWAAVLVITVVSGWSLHNYYLNQHFHNPIFVMPTREIVRDIHTASQDGDIIFAPKDSGVPYYHDVTNSALRLFTSAPEARDHIQSQRPGRIWIVTLGRDATREATPEEFLDWIDERYRLSQTQGYVEQDPLYRRAKEALLHRPAYRYKVTLQLYEAVDEGDDSISDLLAWCCRIDRCLIERRPRPL